MKLEAYEMVNDSTRLINSNRKVLEKQRTDIPELGTELYNSLSFQKLILDMEKRFEVGEVRKLPDFIGLLKERECH